MSTAITNGVHGPVLNNKKETIHVSHMNNPFWTMDCLSDAARTGNLPLPQRAEQSERKIGEIINRDKLRSVLF